MQHPWWQTGVLYQIYPRSFADASGDGVGDLRGILGKVDYLKDLGVSAVWISPFFPSPMADFGYDVSDYCDVDPLFGSLADFDALLDALHSRGMKMVVDLVLNHCSDHHAWFGESRASRTSPKRDWFVWRDPAPDGGPPNNWVAVFGGPAWTLDAHTGQYYLHTFLPQQPDLNWRNPEVVAAMHDVMRFWLDRGVDGFRLDAVYFIAKDPELRDNPPNPNTGAMHKAMGEYDRFLHAYDKAHPDMHTMLEGLREVTDAYPDRVLYGELHEYDLTKWARYFGTSLNSLHLPGNFSLLTLRYEAAHARALIEAVERATPEGAWPNYVLGNHDEVRLATRYGGEAQAKLLAFMLLTLRGTPVWYAGDELGIAEVPIPRDQIQDPWGIRVPEAGVGRDGCRTPMAWTDAPGHGFSVAHPWLPFHPDAASRNVAVQAETPGSMLRMVQALLRLRAEHPALHAGGWAPIAGLSETVLGYTRTLGEDVFSILLNFSEHAVPLPPWRNSVCLLSTHAEHETGRLLPHQAVLLAGLYPDCP